MADLEAFRAEVRAFLAEKLDPWIRACTARQAGVQPEPEVAKRWHRILYEKGWITPMWPREHGGIGWTPQQQALFLDECALAGAPKLPGMGIRMYASVVMRFGTEEQKAFFLPRIRSGEHYWCQGFSEPGAGSDLASLSTRARREGDDYVVNGSKIWTTHAHAANWIFLLVRTSSEGRPQNGITFLVAPLDTPGIEVRPIRSMSGEHELNEVFFQDVRIPVTNRIGEENDGWTVAKHLLKAERGGSTYEPVFSLALAELRRIALAEESAGRPLIESGYMRRAIAEVEIEASAIICMEARLDQRESDGDALDCAPSLKKLTGAEMVQRISALTLEALGPYSRADQSACLGLGIDLEPVGPDYAATPMASYLNKRAISIYGGAREVQKDIIAKSALRL